MKDGATRIMASVADVMGFGSDHHYDYNHRHTNDNAYSQADPDVARGMRLFRQLFHRGNVVEGKLVISGFGGLGPASSL